MPVTENPTLDEIPVNERYNLSLLKSVRCDDIRQAFVGKRCIYVCSYPDNKWHDTQGIPVLRNYAIRKKTQFFGMLSRRSLLVSPTQCINRSCVHTAEVRYRKVLLGSRWREKRLQQCEYLFQLLCLFVRLRRSFDYVLFYNFEMPVFFSAYFVKWILKKEVWVDFEDDYTLVHRSRWKNLLATQLAYNMPDVVICASEPMTKHFPTKKTFVFNGFIELHPSATNFWPNAEREMRFMYSGRLDDIRGVDLLPEVFVALQRVFRRVRVLVTGEGPLEATVRAWQIPGIEYLGFLHDEEFAQTLSTVDAFLVLQKPDHPFSRGSFPSKIEYYARLRRPIYVLSSA
jgi:glycosyltransferase involved in cell wall biosynthesis